MNKRLEDPKDLNYSFREGRAKDKQKKHKTQSFKKMKNKIRNIMHVQYTNQLKYKRGEGLCGER